jgi:hypothetical protein
MKKFIVGVIFCLAISVSAFAHSPLPELDKIKQIKLLESTRGDVKRIFAGYKERVSALDDFSVFSSKNFWFIVEYSGAGCDYDDWNVREGRVTYITISFDKSIKPEDLAVDLSSLRKEKKYVDSSENFIYHDKSLGFMYDTCKSKIISMKLFPPKETLPFLCNNSKQRKFYQSERWSNKRIKKFKKNRRAIARYFANVTELTLSSNEISVGCDSDNSEGNKNCAESVKVIEVSADYAATPCTDDTVTFNYTISGGKITGQGEKVVWDLSGVKPGTYTITASVDTGCGVCGTTRTEEVVVKECPGCKEK